MHKKWNLGDRCFIANIQCGENYNACKIMPALVTHIGGIGDSASYTATALASKSRKNAIGKTRFEGEPFETKAAAREHILHFAKNVMVAAKNAVVTGRHQKVSLPSRIPQTGDVVYTIDWGAKEVLEVVVYHVNLMGKGKIEVAYSPSPQSEVSCIELIKWYRSRAAANKAVRKKYQRSFTFISREKVARRADAEIEKIWTDAQKYTEKFDFKTLLKVVAEL